MKLKDLYEMSMQDLRDAERVIEYLFKDLGLDVVWSTHFKKSKALFSFLNSQKRFHITKSAA